MQGVSNMEEGTGGVIPPPKPPDGNGGKDQVKISFRDKLMGSQQPLPRKEKVDLLAKNLFKIELEDGDRLKPRCYIDEGILQELWQPWQDAIIVTLLGKTLGYLTMRDKLKAAWRPTGGMDMVDIGSGFFMVKFDLLADKEKVIHGGPWMIFDHYVAVRPWTPDFIASNIKINTTMVWIRFPFLGMEYYDESVLMALAAAVGKPVKVDIRTIDASRGKFARVCVEINLDQPVVGRVWFRNTWFNVQYEGLHLLCKECGLYGHIGRNCTAKVNSVQTPAAEKVGGDVTGITEQEESNVIVDAKVNAKANNWGSLYHDALVVEKQNRAVRNHGKKVGHSVGPHVNKFKAHRNHFQVLTDNDVEDGVFANANKEFFVGSTFQVGENSKSGERRSGLRKKRQRKESLPKVASNNNQGLGEKNTEANQKINPIKSKTVPHGINAQIIDRVKHVSNNVNEKAHVSFVKQNFTALQDIQIMSPQVKEMSQSMLQYPKPPDPNAPIVTEINEDVLAVYGVSFHRREDAMEMVDETPEMLQG